MHETQSELSRAREALDVWVSSDAASELITRNALLAEQLSARADELQCALTRVQQLEDELEAASAAAAAVVTVATVGTGSKMSVSDEASSSAAAASDKATTNPAIDPSISASNNISAHSATAIRKKGVKVKNEKIEERELTRGGTRIPVSQEPSSSRGRISSAGKSDSEAVNGASAVTSKRAEDEARQVQAAEQLQIVTNELLQLKASQTTWHSEKNTIMETLSARETDVKQLSVALETIRIEVARLTSSLAAAQSEAHIAEARSLHLESEKTAMEKEKNELLEDLRQAAKVSSGEFAQFKDTSDKTVASMESQRDLDAATVEQLTQTAREAQTDLENLQLKHAEVAKRIAERDEMVKKGLCGIELLTKQLAEVTNNKALSDARIAQLQLEQAECTKRVAEQDETVKEGMFVIESLTKQLADATNKNVLAEARIAQLQLEHVEIAKRTAKQDEVVKKGSSQVESLTKQLAEATNKQVLADAQIVQLQLEQTEIAKHVAEQDEMVRQWHSKELAQETRVAKLESQLLALENEHETHMLGCGKTMSSMQQEKASADDRIAEQDEMVKKGLFVIESLTIQLAEVANNKALADARIAQLENQCKTDSDALAKQVSHVSLARSFNVRFLLTHSGVYSVILFIHVSDCACIRASVATAGPHQQ